MTTNTVSRATARRGLIFVVLAAALWGTSGVATKTIYTLVDISPISVAAFRLALGAPMLFIAFRLANGSRSHRVARADLAWMLLAGAALGMSQACYFAAIARVGVAIATLVTICTTPVLVCLFSAALLRERLTRAVVGSLICALIGTVLMIGVGQQDSSLQASATLGGIGAVLLLAVSAITTGITVDYPWPVWALFLYLGLVPTALGYALFYLGVQHTTASEASIASLVEPLTATGLALIIFGEHLGALGLLGATLLISAIVFLYRSGSSGAG